MNSSCTWLERFLTGDYSTKDVFRDLSVDCPVGTNSTLCVDENQTNYNDHKYYNYTLADDLFNYLLNSPSSDLGVRAKFCLVKACRDVGATGNPDMAGIGMIAAYLFLSAFVAISYLSQLTRPTTGDDKAYDNGIRKYQCTAAATHKSATFLERARSAIVTHNHAMDETMAPFLSAAIFFALSIAVGGLGVVCRNETTFYERGLLGHMSLLTSGPLYATLAFSSKRLRRKRLCRNLISFVAILLMIIPFLSGEPASEVSEGTRWDAVCKVDYPLLKIAYRVEIVVAYAILTCESCRLLLWPIQLTINYFLPKCVLFTEMSKEQPWDQVGRRSWWQRALCFLKRYIYNWELEKRTAWVVATFGLAITFAGGGFLASNRCGLRNLAGDSYMESEMTYGQYLAALIWLPVLVEYGYVVMVGVTRALESRLPTPYAIVSNEESQHSPPNTPMLAPMRTNDPPRECQVEVMNEK